MTPFRAALTSSGIVPLDELDTVLASIDRELGSGTVVKSTGSSPSVQGSTPRHSQTQGHAAPDDLILELADSRESTTPPGAAAKSPTRAADERLATELVRREVLTHYQADQLLAGLTKLTLGPYLITDWIGEGGMGQVFKAVHKVMGRECAVKVLPYHKTTEQAKKVFLREIRAQARLDHPHLVRAFDAGEDGKVRYLVVEYVPGANLRRLVRLQEKLSMRQAASIITQAALGLAHAHSKGLIHRDVKPGNILVTPDGIAKVSDLGLAGYLGEKDADPLAGKVMGTADYLSPEQIRGQDTSPASDIYSLGCTLYYAVTGKVPFPTGTAASKAVRHCEGQPYHPRMFNPELSEEFVEVIADMTEKDPKDRPESMEIVAERLAPWAETPVALSQRRLSRSPWIKSPVPTGELDLQEMVFLEEASGTSVSELGGSGGMSPSRVRRADLPSVPQGSAMSESQASALLTGPTIVPPPPPPEAVASAYEVAVRKMAETSRIMTVFMTLVVAVPLCLFLGTLLGFFLALLLVR